MILVLQIAVVLAQLYVMMALIKITKAKIRVEGRLDEVLDDLGGMRARIEREVVRATKAETERDALQKASIPLLEAMFNLRDGHYIVDEQKVFPLNAALSGCENIAEQMAQFSIWKDVPDDDEETDDGA